LGGFCPSPLRRTDRDPAHPASSWHTDAQTDAVTQTRACAGRLSVRTPRRARHTDARVAAVLPGEPIQPCVFADPDGGRRRPRSSSNRASQSSNRRALHSPSREFRRAPGPGAGPLSTSRVPGPGKRRRTQRTGCVTPLRRSWKPSRRARPPSIAALPVRGWRAPRRGGGRRKAAPAAAGSVRDSRAPRPVSAARLPLPAGRVSRASPRSEAGEAPTRRNQSRCSGSRASPRSEAPSSPRWPPQAPPPRERRPSSKGWTD
jgi:hypothetical protein